MTHPAAPFALPLRRVGDASILDAHGLTVLVVDPERAIDTDRPVAAIADYVFAMLAVAPAAPQAAGVGALDREISRMREVARDWRRPALQQVEGPNDLKIYGGTIADDIDRWADLLAALRAPSRGPRGGAVRNALSEAVATLDKVIIHVGHGRADYDLVGIFSRSIATGRMKQKTTLNLGDVRHVVRLGKAALATREEALASVVADQALKLGVQSGQPNDADNQALDSLSTDAGVDQGHEVIVDLDFQGHAPEPTIHQAVGQSAIVSDNSGREEDPAEAAPVCLEIPLSNHMRVSLEYDPDGSRTAILWNEANEPIADGSAPHLRAQPQARSGEGQ